MAETWLELGWSGGTVGEVLEWRIARLLALHRDRRLAAAELLQASGCARGTLEEILGAELSLDTARLAIARDHQFKDWSAAVANSALLVDADFEAAASAIPGGDFTLLEALLDARPELVRMRSPFGHHTMLLHLIAANGVEMARQWRCPPNAVAITRLLLERGAEPDASCDAYGGGSNQTPLCLLVSSVHPANAGLQAALVEELCRGRALVNGVDDDGQPLRTAISFGYSAAAEALVRCGARVDNLLFAAAMGDLVKVQSYFAGSGDVRSEGSAGVHMLEYALISAAAHGRRSIVEFLLSKQPDLSISEPTFGATAAGAARYHKRAEIVALLDSYAH